MTYGTKLTLNIVKYVPDIDLNVFSVTTKAMIVSSRGTLKTHQGFYDCC